MTRLRLSPRKSASLLAQTHGLADPAFALCIERVVNNELALEDFADRSIPEHRTRSQSSATLRRLDADWPGANRLLGQFRQVEQARDQ